MLMSEIVTMRWNSNNKKRYTEKGYIYTKMKDEFEVLVSDLPEFSKVLVVVKCDYCGVEFNIKWEERNKRFRDAIIKNDCCAKCRGLKQNESFKNKYGVTRPTQLPKIQKKTRQTNLKKYGFAYISQVPAIKDKIRQTNLEKRGVEYSLQCPVVKDKSKKTNLEKYGVEYYSQSEDFAQKYRESCQKKYGVDNAFQSEEIKNKIIETNLKKYGVEYAQQNPLIKQKTLETMYRNNSFVPTSNQQKYLHLLLGGKCNYPVSNCCLDIAFLDKKIYLEYDGGGHELSVILGSITKENFDMREIGRYYFLKGMGWRQIVIQSIKDLLPHDSTIKNMIKISKHYLDSNHTWIKFDIDNGLIKCSEYERYFDFGELRKIFTDDVNLLQKEAS